MNNHLTMFNIFPLQIFLGPKAPNSFISSRYYTGGYLFNVSHHWLSHTSANICSAPNLCRRPLGVLHAERVHGHRPRVHLQALFCPRQREALRHERTPASPHGILYIQGQGDLYFFFRRRPLQLRQRTHVFLLIPLRSMPLLYVLEQHSAAAHAARFFHACK